MISVKKYSQEHHQSQGSQPPMRQASHVLSRPVNQIHCLNESFSP